MKMQFSSYTGENEVNGGSRDIIKKPSMLK